MVLACLIAGSPSLDGQTVSRERVHEGFHIGFGLSAASYNLACRGCIVKVAPAPDWNGGVGSEAYFRIGGAVSPQLLLGGEIDGRAMDVKDETHDRESTIGQLLFVAQYYLSESGGFHVTAGVGPAVVELTSPGTSVRAVGYSLRGGVGYDFDLGRRFSLTPFVKGGITRLSDDSLEIFNGPPTVSKFAVKRLFEVGLGFNWY